MKYIMIFLVRIYQGGISPLLGSNCRFAPTCSEYFVQALKEYGFFKGSALGFKRISRCHPWGGSGIDPVPTKNEKNKDRSH